MTTRKLKRKHAAKAAEPQVPVPQAAPVPQDEGVAFLNQAFADATDKGLALIAANIAGGTSRVLWLARRVRELEQQVQHLAAVAAPLAPPAAAKTTEAPPG